MIASLFSSVEIKLSHHDISCQNNKAINKRFNVSVKIFLSTSLLEEKKVMCIGALTLIYTT